MTFVSFFAGIGGIDLGLERARHRCVGQVEIDPFCNKVLAKHWPSVWRHDDILTLKAEDIPEADLWTGGFPCQDISNAGKRTGIRGARSGLFFDWMQSVRMVRPSRLLLENVAALLTRGMGEVCGELAESGYDAEWDCIPAAAVGAPHIRNRVFILADSHGAGCRSEDVCEKVPDATSIRCKYNQPFAGGFGTREEIRGLRESAGKLHWATEPDVGRVAHGVPSRVDRLRSLGNAVVPQVSEWIGQCLMNAK